MDLDPESSLKQAKNKQNMSVDNQELVSSSNYSKDVALGLQCLPSLKWVRWVQMDIKCDDHDPVHTCPPSIQQWKKAASYLN